MRRLRGEDGAAAIFVGIMLVMLLGFGALAIDVSALYQEKRELQNGADGAALAAAQECAVRLGTGPTCASHTDPALTSLTAQYANANANDSESNAEITAHDPSNPLGTNWSANQLQTHTSTSADGGNAFMTHYLAQLIGHPSSEVHAYATARWGNVGSLNGGIPLTFSQCEWKRFTSGGTVFSSEPWDPGAQEIIDFHDGNTTEPCHSFSSGMEIPGGFGWLTTDGASCETTIDREENASEDPGASASTGCDAATVRALLGTVILIPVFDNASGLGANGTYHIWGFAAFYLTSYRLGGSPEWNGVHPGFSSCQGSRPGDVRCLGGYFTQFVDIGAVFDPDAPFTGLTTVQLTG